MSSRILLIEPDTVLGQIYEKALKTEGYQTALVADAQNAVRTLDQQPFDLVVLELQLIEHGGAEFIYELRSYSEWAKMPIVIHTLVPMHAVGFTKAQLKQLGIVAYLYKPTTAVRQLTQAIEAVLPVAV
jgi:DNA-binding response OmpR family regulator